MSGYNYILSMSKPNEGRIISSECKCKCFLLQSMLNLYPYHIDALLQLNEISRMTEDMQMATDLIGCGSDYCEEFKMSIYPAEISREVSCCFVSDSPPSPSRESFVFL